MCAKGSEENNNTPEPCCEGTCSSQSRPSSLASLFFHKPIREWQNLTVYTPDMNKKQDVWRVAVFIVACRIMEPSIAARVLTVPSIVLPEVSPTRYPMNSDTRQGGQVNSKVIVRANPETRQESKRNRWRSIRRDAQSRLMHKWNHRVADRILKAYGQGLSSINRSKGSRSNLSSTGSGEDIAGIQPINISESTWADTWIFGQCLVPFEIDIGKKRNTYLRKGNDISTLYWLSIKSRLSLTPSSIEFAKLQIDWREMNVETIAGYIPSNILLFGRNVQAWKRKRALTLSVRTYRIWTRPDGSLIKEWNKPSCGIFTRAGDASCGRPWKLGIIYRRKPSYTRDQE